MNKTVGWIAGLFALLALSALALRYYLPPLPGALDLAVVFAPSRAGASEPLAVTGQAGAGDFVYVKFLDETTVAFGYDRWGAGGPVSAPVKIQPGVRYALRLELPSLAQVRGSAGRAPERLRVALNGAIVLEAPARYEERRASRAWFGENPIGGSSCGPHFSGELFRADGRPICGGVRQILSVRDRIAGWLWFGRWQVLGILLGSLGVGWAAAGLARTRGRALREYLARHRLGPHRWFITAAGLCVIAFSWLITGGTGQFIFPESFGNFYDCQAASLLQGRLDVPGSAISGEAFVVDGKSFGYFGVTPALLRLPFVIFDVAFGELSRCFMLGYYLACLVAAYAILRHATRRLGGDDARPSPWAMVLFTLCVGLGSTLFFLGSRAYIYHEAILCGGVFALWSVWCSLRWLQAPDSRAWLGALGCGVLAVHARPSSGLFALTMVGCTAVAVALAQKKFRRPLLVAALSVAGVLSFNGLSYLKFKTFDGSPFRYSVQYTPERRARFDNKNFHAVNLPHNLDVYVLRADFSLKPNFPWFYGGGQPRRHHPEAKMDLTEMTVGLPFAMPGLFALALVGGIWTYVRSATLRRPLLVLGAALLPMALALFTAVVTSHRYTADFVPWLIAVAALALALLDAESGWRRRAFLAAASTLAILSIAIAAALSLHFQGEQVWGVPDETKQCYQQLRRRVDAFFGVKPRK
jgi:hypothetical protein